jgi:predicted CXXCH cytochrome family protein
LFEEFGLVRSAALSLVMMITAVLPAAGADIRLTPHNLTQKGAGVEADEVCVFCHTPQLAGIANRSGAGASPAWQRSVPETHSYVLYDDIGRLQFGDKAAVGSQSIACLSCHDANQAFSVVSAAPDHPFGIPYRGFSRGRERLAAENIKHENVPFREARELKALDEFRLPSHGMVDNRMVWWVSAEGVSALRTRSDLPLYARQLDIGEVPYVECSSCHDPHISTKLFLRVKNDGSRLCLTCHDK